jgi:tripartite-type tricarboxylate transporter receptor subunit TctC
MKFIRNGLWAGALGALSVVAASAQDASNWPSSPVDVIVAYGAGGGTDSLSRILTEYFSQEAGQPFVVQNKPGAGGTIGAAEAARATPDGNTMYMMAAGHSIAAAMNASLPYDPVNDYAGITQIAELPFIFVVRPDTEFSTIPELIARAKANPGDLTFASVGVGSTQHFVAELLMSTADIDMLHIPYQKTPEALAALLSGEVDILVEVIGTMIGQVQAGDIKALGITTAGRHPALPDVATVSEAGYDYEVAGWYGISFPAGTSPEIVAKANELIARVVANNEVKARLLESGLVVKTSTPAEFQTFLADEVTTWNSARETAGIPQR